MSNFSQKAKLLGILLFLSGGALALGIYVGGAWWVLSASILVLVVLAFQNRFQSKHAVLRNYPVLGYFRYFFEMVRPELRQYFFESDLDGKPFNRRQRSIVYQRAKNVRQTVPFGTQFDTRAVGYEWIAHSMYPVHIKDKDMRVMVGGKDCRQPYSASILNISAMSYGSLSKNAMLSLNGGARLGNFAHNTGEGGISPYHLEQGGDLIWQVGTGYFGCRDEKGNFSDHLFRQNALLPNVKMIELKLSQGAKPGHGGILPAAKNTPEIAAIRHVQPYTEVLSPPGHSAFHNHRTMLVFIDQLKELADGKPVGIKMCIGRKDEFEALCKEMQLMGITPDYIAIDGGEGGTGAAPLEFSDDMGMPLYDALSFASHTLTRYGLRDKLRIAASGKIITGFDVLKAVALGADFCYSARGMMMALGCIQALQCDSGHCPVGVATQDPKLYEGLVVTDKRVRVANFHRNTVKATVEMMEACNMSSMKEVLPELISRRVNANAVMTFNEIYFKQYQSQPSDKPDLMMSMN